MYGCESWTIKKARLHRIYVFELWYWRRFLRVPWIARRSNQSTLKEINCEYSLEGLILKLQYFSHLMQEPTHWKRPWCWERLRPGGERGNRGWDGWMAAWAKTKMDMSFSKFWEIVKDREAWHAALHRVAKSWAQLKRLNNKKPLLLPPPKKTKPCKQN